jgi:hypothetical protein
MTRLAQSLLYKLEPTDPLTFAITVTVLLIAGAAAGLYSRCSSFASGSDDRVKG